jgi:hypothetical protein
MTDHFDQLTTVLKQMKSVKQPINMDETGNMTRAEKKRRKHVVYSRKTMVEGDYQDCTEVTDLSLVSTISLSGNTLKRLLLTISDVHDNNIDLNLQHGSFIAYKAPKGYTTSIMTAFDLKETIRPYSDAVRAEIGDLEALIF